MTSLEIFSGLSPKISRRIIVHIGERTHVKSTHPNALLPLVLAIFAGICIKKSQKKISPANTRNKINPSPVIKNISYKSTQQKYKK